MRIRRDPQHLAAHVESAATMRNYTQIFDEEVTFRG